MLLVGHGVLLEGGQRCLVLLLQLSLLLDLREKKITMRSPALRTQTPPGVVVAGSVAAAVVVVPVVGSAAAELPAVGISWRLFHQSFERVLPWDVHWVGYLPGFGLLEDLRLLIVID